MPCRHYGSYIGWAMTELGRRYERIGHGYARLRREDPRIAEPINVALGDAHTVVNVGAGSGSYEPRERYVLDARNATSGFARMPDTTVDRVVAALERDLASGAWDRRHRHLRELDELDVGLRLVVATPS